MTFRGSMRALVAAIISIVKSSMPLKYMLHSKGKDQNCRIGKCKAQVVATTLTYSIKSYIMCNIPHGHLS